MNSSFLSWSALTWISNMTYEDRIHFQWEEECMFKKKVKRSYEHA